MKKQLHVAIGIAVLSVAAAACGTATAEPTPTTTTMPGHAHDMDAMNMGDETSLRADAVAGAELVEGTFAGLGDSGEPSGTAWLARHEAGTTVTIEVHGLVPGAEFMSHVHAGSCAAGGGPHFRFDPDGDHHPPNEIHLAFAADTNGHGFMTVVNEQVAGPSATAVAIHAVDGDASDWLCADLD